ncbi:hypothetical protein LCGC14_2561480 [marine sediment metagenome]|uniref:Uncharacterized protein n=1 Tax=marine sediment metagenome TaxID=412755 RepID=A0A0F9AJY1_9ZZZZ
MNFVEEATKQIMIKRPASDANDVRQAMADLIVILQKDEKLLDAMLTHFED